jgi:hypothetical protein
VQEGVWAGRYQSVKTGIAHNATTAGKCVHSENVRIYSQQVYLWVLPNFIKRRDYFFRLREPLNSFRRSIYVQNRIEIPNRPVVMFA